MERYGSRYAFGPYTLDAASRRLFRGRCLVPVNGKALELLLLLVRNRGAALSREEIYGQLWPEGDVGDGNLTQNVHLVRRALDPQGTGRAYIETQPRFGYRFCAPVHQNARNWRPPLAALFALALVVMVGGTSGTLKVTPPSADADEAKALGTYHLHMRTVRELQYARTYFEQTVQLAPRLPAGYAGLAAADALLAEYDADGSREQQRELTSARRYDEHALVLDARSSDALAVAGFIGYRFDQDAARARQLLSAALASDPTNAAAHHWQGVLELVEGNPRAAVAELEAAHRLDPASEVFARWLARSYAYAGRTRDALRMVADALRIEPDDEASMLVRASAQEQRGDLRAALQTLRALGARDPWERPFVNPDEARLEAELHPAMRHAMIARVDEAIARNAADRFEAALFYATVGLDAHAHALLRATHPTFITAGLDNNDPRFKRIFAGTQR